MVKSNQIGTGIDLYGSMFPCLRPTPVWKQFKCDIDTQQSWRQACGRVGIKHVGLPKGTLTSSQTINFYHV